MRIETQRAEKPTEQQSYGSFSVNKFELKRTFKSLRPPKNSKNPVKPPVPKSSSAATPPANKFGRTKDPEQRMPETQDETIDHRYEGKTHIPSDSRPLGPRTKNNHPKKIPKSQASYKPTSSAFRLLKHSATLLKKGISFVKTALTVVNDVLDLTKKGLDTITSLMKSITPNTQDLPKEGKSSHKK